MGDLALFNNKIAGDLSITNGQPIIDDGLETAVFISLYSGVQADYWGNDLEVNRPDYRYGGEYEKLSTSLELTVPNALRLEQAAKRDLQWLINESIASQINTASEIKGNSFFIFITIVKPNDTSINFKFESNWDGQFNNPAGEQ